MSGERRFRLAVVQSDIVAGRPAENVERAAAQVEVAVRDRGARVVSLPEMFSTGYDWASLLDAAEPLSGPTVECFRDLCRRLGVWLLLGSLPERRADGTYNTSVLIADTGEIAGQYSKIHLFSLMDEPRYLRPGNGPTVVDTPLARVGLTVCYDLRFPELYRRLCLDGAELIFVPAEWPHPRAPHWETLLRARAIENQVFVVGNNRVGRDGEVAYCGRSQIIDPWGRILSRADEEPTILTADVDLADVHAARQRMPCLADRRPECY